MDVLGPGVERLLVNHLAGLFPASLCAAWKTLQFCNFRLPYPFRFLNQAYAHRFSLP